MGDKNKFYKTEDTMKKDDRERCSWATTELYKEYHDGEWGKPVHDDRKLFEMLVLEGMQAGTRRYCRGPRKAAWLCGERRSSGASEFCRLRRNERYAACDDEAGSLFGENGNGKQNGGNA